MPTYLELCAAANIHAKLDDAIGTSGTILNDGTGADLSILGSPTFEETGTRDTAALLVSGDAFLSTDLAGVVVSSFSASLWYKSGGASLFKNIFGCRDATNNRIQFSINASNQVSVNFRNSGGSVYQNITNHSPSVNIEDGSWHLVTVVFDGTNGMKLYIDAVNENATLANNTTGGTLTLPHEFAVGGYNNDGTVGTGSDRFLDDFIFHANVAWTDTDILNFYNGPVSVPAGTTTITSPSDLENVERPNVPILITYNDTDQTGFEIEISHDNFTSIYFTDTFTTGPYNTLYQLLDKECDIRIRAINGGGGGAWSSPIHIIPDNLPITIDWGIAGRGVASLTVSALTNGSVLFFQGYLASKFPTLTCDTKFFFVWGEDHEDDTRVFWGKGNSPILADFVQVGQIFGNSDLLASNTGAAVDYISLETVQILYNPNLPEAQRLMAIGHVQRDIFVPEWAEQVTLLFTSIGGGELHNITWNYEKEIIDLSNTTAVPDVTHTGYESTWLDEDTNVLTMWGRYNSGGLFTQARHKSVDGGLNWSIAEQVFANPSTEKMPSADAGWGHAPQMAGMFKYRGRYFYPRKTNALGYHLMEMDSLGNRIGRIFILDDSEEVGNEISANGNPAFDGTIRDNRGRTYIDEEGKSYWFISANVVNNANTDINVAVMDLSQLPTVEAAGDGSRLIDTNQLANGEYSVKAISRRSEGDRFDSVDVTVSN